MKFSANRQAMMDAVKTVLKAVGNNKDIPQISGILVEANADAGILTLTCTDIRNQIQRILRNEHIEESGSLIIPPLIFDILRLLDGESVDFYDDGRTIEITCGGTHYNLPYLPSKGFPKVQMPFPEDTISVKGINSLIRQTVFATEKNTSSPDQLALQHVKLSFSNGITKAEATDGKLMAISKSPHCADGNLELVLHESALSIIGSIVKPDEELYVGVADKYAVFMNENMIFSTILFAGEFTNSDMFLSRIEPIYRATTDGKLFYGLVDSITSVIRNGDDPCINLNIGSNGIFAYVETEAGKSQNKIPASDTVPTPENGFNYFPKLLLNCLRHISGPATISLNNQGFMILNGNQSQYVICPRSPHAIKRKSNKTEKSKKERKAKKETKVNSDKAA